MIKQLLCIIPSTYKYKLGSPPTTCSRWFATTKTNTIAIQLQRYNLIKTKLPFTSRYTTANRKAVLMHLILHKPYLQDT